MVFKGIERDTIVYALIAIFVIVVIIFAVLFSTNQLFPTMIQDKILNPWREDVNELQTSSNLFGLEKWSSRTYRNYNSTYPAYLTVTTMKTLFMINENDLLSKTEETIRKAASEGIVIDENSKVTGVRALANGHQTHYIIYDGNDTSKNPNESIKIIGEAWNCGVSGTSIICIGYAQITDNANNGSMDLSFWSKIVSDEVGTLGADYINKDGLIFNVVCH